MHPTSCAPSLGKIEPLGGPAVLHLNSADTLLEKRERQVSDHTEAATYALPPALAARHRIRRYGFHGIAHASLADGYARATGQRLVGSRLITVHLGNGCSATAMKDGRSVDTSMGFTPLEGLMRGTRSGDLDPAVVSYLARHIPMPVEDVERLLNQEAGLLGVSGLSHDMRTILTAVQQQQDARAALAVELCRRRLARRICRLFRRRL